MTSNKEFLTNLQPCNLESITFSDGVKGTGISSGLLKVPSMPKLENFLLVNGLKINLRFYLLNLLKTNAQSLIVLTNVLWKEKDHQTIALY